MAGHSKWKNIQHRKNKQDAKRGKIFTRLIREITVAARTGGDDPNMNAKLRLAMDRAQQQNMPKDNIERAILKGMGAGGDVVYEAIRYEGYGPGGVALMVDCLTDNRNRTVSEVRYTFTKYGGSLGTDGSVAYLFKHQGMIMLNKVGDEETFMMAAIDAGADDFEDADQGWIVTMTPSEYEPVLKALRAVEASIEHAEVTYVPENMLDTLTLEEQERAFKLYDALDDLDDVQATYINIMRLDDE